MYFDTQSEALGPCPLPPSVNPFSASSISRPSSSQNDVFSSSFDIDPFRGWVSGDSSSDTEERLAHLTLTPAQQNITSDSNSERARKLKSLPGCTNVKEIGLRSMEQWGKSFKLTEQELLFEDLEPLEALKKKTNSHLIQNLFEALVQFSAGAKSCFDKFQALRKPFDDLASAKHTTVTHQAKAAIKLHEELTKNAKTLGKNANIILDCRSEIWKFQKTSVKETQDKVDSMLCVEHDYQEDIQFALDLLKDGERIAPKIKEPSGLAAAFLEGVGKYGFLKLAKRYKNKWQGSKMLQDIYQGEKSKTDALSQKLDESESSLYAAQTVWSGLDVPIYTNIFMVIDKIILNDTNVSFVAIANELDEAEGKLLTLIELIESFLGQIAQDYGLKFCTREVKRLCSRVPNIFTALEMLLSAKEVIVNDQQRIYEEYIYELCKAILEHFNIIKEVHWECRISVNVERQAAFLRDDVPEFQNGVAPHLQAIKDIAQTHISKVKSKEALKKREKDDRYHGDSAFARPGRPLVTGDEILWALYKVIDALLLIRVAMGASTASDEPSDENANSVEETAANDSMGWFDMPNETLDQFYGVLFGEARKLEFLMDQGERQKNERLDPNDEPKPVGHLSRLRRLMARKLH